jgi:hypothetical protein
LTVHPYRAAWEEPLLCLSPKAAEGQQD